MCPRQNCQVSSRADNVVALQVHSLYDVVGVCSHAPAYGSTPACTLSYRTRSNDIVNAVRLSFVAARPNPRPQIDRTGLVIAAIDSCAVSSCCLVRVAPSFSKGCLSSAPAVWLRWCMVAVKAPKSSQLRLLSAGCDAHGIEASQQRGTQRQHSGDDHAKRTGFAVHAGCTLLRQA